MSNSNSIDIGMENSISSMDTTRGRIRSSISIFTPMQLKIKAG
jgi:hypothetical protein